MAGYDYTSTYYSTYFWFQTSGDTGSGSESVKPFPFTSPDTGHGLDASGTINFFFSSSDTGSGADANSPPSPRGSDGWTGTEVATPGPHSADAASPAADNGGVTGGAFTVADADSGSGGEGLPSAGLTDGDLSNAVEIDQISDFDSWAGADDAQLALTDADAVSGADAAAAIAFADADIQHGNDFGANFGIVAASTDTGTGTDTGNQPAIPLASADTGAGADAVSSILPAITGADTSSGAETQVLAATLSSADAGFGADVANVRPDADAGSGADFARVGVSSADAFSAAETSPIPPAHVLAGDIATSIDGGSVNTPSKFDADTGFGLEGTPALLVFQSSADFWHLASESSAIDNADILFGTEEAFSLMRAAVLIPGNGAELAQLPGCRDGTMEPQITVTHSTADDSELIAWYDMSVVNVTVSGGFISFPALSVILGYPVSTDSNGRVSVPYGLQRVAPSVELPMVFRAESRGVAGRPRSFDVLLYRVRFTELTIESFAYKNGVVASWTGFGLQANFDEQGLPLRPSARDFGRIISYPGQMPGPIPAPFGTDQRRFFIVSSDFGFSLDGKPNALPTPVASADTVTGTDSPGVVHVGSSGADFSTSVELGMVTAATASDGDTGSLLDGKPPLTVLLLSDSDTGSVFSNASVLVGGTAKNDVDVAQADDGAVAEIDVASADTGSVFSNANVNIVGGTSFITDNDDMFNNEHPGSGEQGTYIQIIGGGVRRVALTIGGRVPPGTWSASVPGQIGRMETQRLFFSGALPSDWSAANFPQYQELPHDGSVIVIVSYKTQTTNVASFISHIPNNVPCWLIYHHEPENDYANGATFVSEFVAQSALIRSSFNARPDNGINCKVAFTGGSSPYQNNKDNAQSGSFIPPPSSVDYYGLDIYRADVMNSSTSIKTNVRWQKYLAAVDAQSAAQGSASYRTLKPFCFFEYGLTNCVSNAVRNSVINNDAAVLRAQFPNPGTTYTGALGNGTTNTPVWKFPLVGWHYWWQNEGTTCDVSYQFTDAAALASWKQVIAGTL